MFFIESLVNLWIYLGKTNLSQYFLILFIICDEHILQDKRLKELFDTIPTRDDLFLLGAEGLKAEIILVDAEKDKKLSRLKQLTAALVKRLSANPALLIKKIAGLVSSHLFFKNQKSLF